MMKRFILALVISMASVSAFAQNPGVTTQGAVALNDCAVFVNRFQIKSAGDDCAGLAPVQSVFGRIGAVVAATNDYNFNQLAGSIACSQYAALAGDITTPSGSCTTTLATVNSNVGTFGSATACPTITVNAKGLITAASAATCTPAFGSLTGSIAIGQIPNSLITYAKIQNMTAATVLGNPTGGAAAPSEITLGTNLSFAGSVLNATGGGGLSGSARTVTSADTVVAGDCNNEIQLGTGSSGMFSLTLPASGLCSAGDVITVTNYDTGRGKQLISFPGEVGCILWPKQTVIVQQSNTGWTVASNPGRFKPTGNILWNVDNVNGNDTCVADGFGTGSQAFKTIPYAYRKWSQHLDGSLTAAGNYVRATIVDTTLTITTDITIYGPPAPGYIEFTGFMPFQIVGAGVFTTSVTSSTAAVHLFQIQGGARVMVDQIRVASTGTGNAGCFLVAEGKLQIGYPSTGAVNFDKCTNTAINAAGNSLINIYGSITVLTTGTYGNFAILESGARGFFNAAVAISGTPSWTTAFINADYNSVWDMSGFTNPTPGSPTGPRYNVTGNATIFTSGFGCANIPGSTAGSAALNGICF